MSSPSTPLAGHLPLEVGDQQRRCWPSSCNVGDWRRLSRWPISPLEGEMPGRAEGGASRYNSLALERVR
ncbi:lytic murein transglycosylase [Mesorhizobium sp. WSM3860]|nr:lytic murein transglycosylase [Mesorhizobium sp. WSM3860]